MRVGCRAIGIGRCRRHPVYRHEGFELVAGMPFELDVTIMIVRHGEIAQWINRQIFGRARMDSEPLDVAAETHCHQSRSGEHRRHQVVIFERNQNGLHVEGLQQAKWAVKSNLVL